MFCVSKSLSLRGNLMCRPALVDHHSFVIKKCYVPCCINSVCLFLVSSFLNSTESIFGNKTYTFLITLDKDLGDLMMLKLRWEGSALWKNVWNRVQTIIPWGGRGRKPLLTVGKISVKAGDTQERYSKQNTSSGGRSVQMF